MQAIDDRHHEELTSMQATSAPVAAFVPATEISAQRAACASMPATIGNASRRHGILLLKPDSQRRTSAPMAALAAISSRLVSSSVPKMAPSEAAPMAANKVKRGVEAGGNRPADSSADCATSAGNVPWQ